MSKIYIQSDNTPEHIKEIENTLRTALVSAKKNPGQTNVFNGKFWVPIEKFIPQLEQLITIIKAQNEALRLTQGLMVSNPNLNVTAAAVSVRKANEFYETGKAPKE